VRKDPQRQTEKKRLTVGEVMQMDNGSTLNGQRLEKEDMKSRMHK